MTSKSGLIRAVVIGDLAVGKTSLLNCAMGLKFNTCEPSTIGANWHVFSHQYCGESIALQIWDTAGQEKYRALGPLYYRTSMGAVIVYDVTRPETFQSLERWIQAFTGTAGTNVAIVIAGSKSDLDEKRLVSQTEALEWCEERGYPCYEVSALTHQNVQLVFETLAEKIVQNMNFREGERDGITPLESGQTQGRSCC
jgi:small GTP-binding protein